MKTVAKVVSIQQGEGITDLVLGAAKGPRRSAWILPVVVAVGVHLGLVLSMPRKMTGEHWGLSTAARIRALLAEREARPVELPPSPPEPLKADAPTTTPSPSVPTMSKRTTKRAEPQSPAQAGQIIASVPVANQPIDFGEAFVVGGAAAYAGGTTMSSGTSKQKVEGPVVAQPVADKPLVPGAPDRSRALSLADPEWTCPWPREADETDIDEQIAIVKVTISVGGRCEKVTVIRDPGHGFGAQAARCAKEAAFLPALDAHGNPTEGSAAIRVRFVR
jgi:periplasmic protein TonB